jgi:hypothetical protein
MPHNALRHLGVLAVWLISTVGVADPPSEGATTDPELLSENRILLGTVEEVRSEQARINTGEGQPRFVPMGVRKDKGLPDLKKGDLVQIAVNDQNLLVDVHLPGEASHHRIVTGQLAGSMQTGHDKAVIRTTDGKEESHLVRPVARSKVASIPVGADVIFLIDELGKIVDVTFGSKEAVQRSVEQSQMKSPLKGNLNRIVGVILKPLAHDRIVVLTDDGTEHSYEVRPLTQQRLGTLAKGDTAILLVDEENKVTDVAIAPSGSGKGAPR